MMSGGKRVVKRARGRRRKNERQICEEKMREAGGKYKSNFNAGFWKGTAP